MHAIAAGVRMQFWQYRAYPDSLIPLCTAPIFAVIFAMIFRRGGAADLSAYALVAPALIALWWFTLFHGGWVVQTERWAQTIELTVAAPAPFPLVVFGRILAVTGSSLLSFVEIWLVGRYVIHARVELHHPDVLLATLLVTAFAMAATAMLMASLFVLARNAVTITNAASYPFYVLGGVLVPVSLLPTWVQPLSRLVFLSWASDLLRASLSAPPVHRAGWRLAAIAVLGAVALAFASLALRVILRRVRSTGELALA